METNARIALPHAYCDPLMGLSEAFIDHAAYMFAERTNLGHFRSVAVNFESFIVGVAAGLAEEGALL